MAVFEHAINGETAPRCQPQALILSNSDRPPFTLLPEKLGRPVRRAKFRSARRGIFRGHAEAWRMSKTLVLLLFLIPIPAFAADAEVKPVSQDECAALAKAVGGAIGLPLKTKVAAPKLPDSLHGTACLLSGKARGLTIGFIAAQDKIESALAGWKHLTDQDADGPFSTVKGYAKDSARFFYSLESEPVHGVCSDNKPIGDCKAPPRQWIWTLEASAFVQ
jgi:hypothetical protein